MAVAFAEDDALREMTDPRCSRPARSLGALVSEVKQGEASIQNMLISDPGRPEAMFKLASGYGELSCLARKAAREATDQASAEKPRKFHMLAQQSAAKYYRALRTEHPSYCWSRDQAVLPEATCADESQYFTGYALVANGARDAGLELYFQLINTKRETSSAYAPYAYAAFGDMFQGDSRRDSSKLKLAQQSFAEVIKYDSLEPGLLAYALLRLGEIHMAQGESALAQRMHVRLAILAQRSPDARVAVAARFISPKLRKDPSAVLQPMELACAEGNAESCAELREILGWKHASADDRARMLRTQNGCEAQNGAACHQ